MARSMLPSSSLRLEPSFCYDQCNLGSLGPHIVLLSWDTVFRIQGQATATFIIPNSHTVPTNCGLHSTLLHEQVTQLRETKLIEMNVISGQRAWALGRE